MNAVNGWTRQKCSSVTADDINIASAEKRMAPRRPIMGALPER